MRIKYLILATAILSLIIFTALMLNDRIKGTVVCFGDSITHGALVDGHSWVYFLSQDHKNINFINAGRNGRKTSDKEELIPVLKKNPDADYFLIFLGVNDLKNGNDSMINNCVENMQWMVDKIHQANDKTKIVILAPTDINLKTMNEINVKKKYSELAKQDSLGFISLFKTVSLPNYVDGLHPDTTGQKQIAKAIWAGLNKLFN